MERLTENKMNELASITGAHCISVYMPTHRSGEEVNQQKDRRNFKNILKELSRGLVDYHLNDREIGEYLQPLHKLYEDKEFWHHQADGLAIFLSGKIFTYFRMPIRFNEQIVIDNRFHLKQLLPELNHHGRFYIMSLDLNNMQLFVADNEYIEELPFTAETPRNIEESLGDDHQAHLQQRTGQDNQPSGRGVYHGHGGLKDLKKDQILKFFREVHSRIDPQIKSQGKAKMVIAGVDYLIPIWKEACNEEHQILEPHIQISPGNISPKELQKQAWGVYEQVFEAKLRSRKERFADMTGKNKASADLREIVRAAINGRIETLFVQENSFFWGAYDPKENLVFFDDGKEADNTDLLDLAAVKTFLNSGEVYLLPEEKMPVENTEINATLRYSL